ncbi:glycoside hydrolase [Clostridioides sp. ES-S-0108-01]|uniref:glycosylhydrolase-like jelly roll fold domain-containing protein n=1 Tax=Clostridioides sp. ES-S-0108-01 TaxID=2770773 RepID=UPI001D0BFD55|nr:glycoside hydrolase [Clostridioides sp. ES-S-0108-01]UDN51694.1 glycoside hydrolase [Clostridioides sp. ES-S-0107-01]
MNKIEILLNNQEKNYIFPFLWMHGEDEKTIRSYIDKIYESGIKEVCVEPRPHPDFAGPRWWGDLRVVIESAKEKNMRVWLFDDCHFPTGYANGAIKNKYPELREKYLKINQLDYHGPQEDAGIIVKWHAGGERNSIMNVGTDKNKLNIKKENEEIIIGVVAAKSTGYSSIDSSTLIDLTDKLEDGVVYWDIPEGQWRIFVLVQTYNGGEVSTENYLNPIDSKATQVLIDEVYETHYEQFGEYFGSTIAGFFSDEPRFGNVKGSNASIGRFEMVLPWRADLMELLSKEIDSDICKLLPLLISDGQGSQRIRYGYMNIISDLYSKNFTDKLANWCVKHNLEYVGHVIEDNNAHARLGYGTGHFFRAISGQTMSGIDVVLHQLLPGMDKEYFRTFTSIGWDGEFFHYTLAKLGSSLGHLDSKKKGRTLCELYGAYGWSEGLNLMKWLTDHMLVRGVNHFIPHAFSMAPFPDSDCAPHFYAHGNNPQYRYLSHLMNYSNRVSELISDGIHIASALILYHAEAEWSGNYMLTQKPAKALTQNQIDFDIISGDLLKDAKLNDNKIIVNKEEFKTLIIPYSEGLPKEILESIKRLVDNNISVIFIDELPSYISNSLDTGVEKYLSINNENLSVVQLDNLVSYLKEKQIYDILPERSEEYLRYYHYKQKEMDVYLFFNESPDSTIINKIATNSNGIIYQYDAMENKLIKIKNRQKDIVVDLVLAPQEATIYIISDKEFKADTKEHYSLLKEEIIKTKWNVSLTDSNGYPNFSDKFVMEKLTNISSPKLYPDFSGTIKYETVFSIEDEKQEIEIDLGNVYEVAEVFLNGVSLGVKMSKPYTFKLYDKVKNGENKLTVEVTNTLGTSQKDFLSQYRSLQPSGIIGDVKIKYYK